MTKQRNLKRHRLAHVSDGVNHVLDYFHSDADARKYLARWFESYRLETADVIITDLELNSSITFTLTK